MGGKAIRVIGALGIVGLGIQLVPVEHTNPPVETEMPAPSAVRAVLKRACYDCHSNQTVWPWYSRIAPVSWLVSHDVSEGRGEMNLSTWNRTPPVRQARAPRRIWNQVQKRKMPLWYYLPLHPVARLTAEDEATLREWAAATAPQEQPTHGEPTR
jgi:hypothetical protein